jgi:hypothetical protein
VCQRKNRANSWNDFHPWIDCLESKSGRRKKKYVWISCVKFSTPHLASGRVVFSSCGADPSRAKKRKPKNGLSAPTPRRTPTACATGCDRRGGPGGLTCLEIWPQGQEPSGAIWALPMWAPGQIEGMRVGGVSGEEATEPHSQRKATAVRSKTQGPAKAAVNHVQRPGKSMSGCSQFSKCCKTKQALTGLILQPRGLA